MSISYKLLQQLPCLSVVALVGLCCADAYFWWSCNMHSCGYHLCTAVTSHFAFIVLNNCCLCMRVQGACRNDICRCCMCCYDCRLQCILWSTSSSFVGRALRRQSGGGRWARLSRGACTRPHAPWSAAASTSCRCACAPPARRACARSCSACAAPHSPRSGTPRRRCQPLRPLWAAGRTIRPCTRCAQPLITWHTVLCVRSGMSI